jgi:aryl-alcohol dehydrogenase-like predicted oxidoreductase
MDLVQRVYRVFEPTRRGFLKRLGRGVIVGGMVGAMAQAGLDAVEAGQPVGGAAVQPGPGRVGQRVLGKTGLKVPEIGFGGHSWAYARVPDGRGGLRKTSPQEAMRMIALGLEMGVNFFDSCTPPEEHTVPGEAVKRLGKRDAVIVSARLCHKMKGVPADKQTIYRWVDERLRLWQTDRFEILMLTNTENDTPASGYWDMSYSLEAVDRLKRQGKIRFAGFGCHFTPERYREAFEKYGRAWDICSLPYNARHRAAEEIIPLARKLDLGMITIKPFARGELLAGRKLAGPDAGLCRDLIAFVLEHRQVDCCICGVHTEEHVRENFSASWTRLTPAGRTRLETLAAQAPCRGNRWLEHGWLAAATQTA